VVVGRAARLRGAGGGGLGAGGGGFAMGGAVVPGPGLPSGRRAAYRKALTTRPQATRPRAALPRRANLVKPLRSQLRKAPTRPLGAHKAATLGKQGGRAVLKPRLNRHAGVRNNKNARRQKGQKFHCSFDGDTLVHTDRGFVPIRDVRVGDDRVWARHETTGEMGWKRVIAHVSDSYDRVYHVKIRNLGTGAEHTIRSNYVHPFYVDGGDWVRASDLKPGQRLLNDDADWSEVVSVRSNAGTLVAFNLTVAEFQTYFIRGNDESAAESVWVHNATHCPIERSEARIGQLRKPAKKMLRGEDILMKPKDGLQSSRGEKFSNVKTGRPGEPNSKYLWTIANRGVNIALEKTKWKIPRGTVVHSNLSSKARIGGEVWFKNKNTVVINSHSGRFGDRAGITKKQWKATVKYWESMGYKVETQPHRAEYKR